MRPFNEYVTHVVNVAYDLVVDKRDLSNRKVVDKFTDDDKATIEKDLRRYYVPCCTEDRRIVINKDETLTLEVLFDYVTPLLDKAVQEWMDKLERAYMLHLTVGNESDITLDSYLKKLDAMTRSAEIIHHLKKADALSRTVADRDLVKKPLSPRRAVYMTEYLYCRESHTVLPNGAIQGTTICLYDSDNQREVM